MKEVQNFYEWLLKINNVHLNDNEQILRACDKVLENNINNINVILN